MRLEDEIKQEKFNNPTHKLTLNLLYTSGWLNIKQIQFFRQYDISPQQYNILRILRGQYPNPASVNLLIDRMLDKMSNASRLVDKLVAKELVVRSKCKSDKRQVDVVIGEKGLELLAEIDKHIDDLDGVSHSLSPSEVDQLNTLLDKLRG